MKIGLFGGTFDPIHHGHLLAARAVIEQIGLDKIYLIPSAKPPHKEGAEQSHRRLEMTRLAVEGDPLFEVSDIEYSRPTKSYTIDTIKYWKSAGTELFFIIGMDNILELNSWKDIEKLVQLIKFVPVDRPIYCDIYAHNNVNDLIQKIGKRAFDDILSRKVTNFGWPISSTEIRNRVKLGKSIRYLVPPVVERYIAVYDLYRS